MSTGVVVVFCMPDRGHFQRLRSVIAGLSREGLRIHVFTHATFRDEVRQAGGIFVDLFAHHTVEQADDESWPPVCRYVSFAGTFVEQIRDEVALLRPSLIVHDTFAVIGSVVARLLAIPYVNVCAGHNVVPNRFLSVLRAHPRVHVADRCLRAVDRLQTVFGLPDLSPFSYMSGLSPHLNLYCEPPQFLPDEDRHVFEPVAFYGSLSADVDDSTSARDRDVAAAAWFGGAVDRALNVYVSFGTAIWMSRTAEALAALGAIAEWVGRQRGVRAVISLGRADISERDRLMLERTNVAVIPYVDQWDILRDSDVFVTHHGLNSTHEAIAHEVPMISYPFVWDQPGMATVCQGLGVATAVVAGVMAPVQPADVGAAIDSVMSNRLRMGEALATAHEWERAVIDGRPGILQRIAGLVLP